VKRIVITSLAKSDIEEATIFLAGDNWETALRFVDSFELSIDLLSNSPGIGREIDFPDYGSVRMWFVTGFRRYLIFYLVERTEVRIVRLVHSSRDYGSLFKN